MVIALLFVILVVLLAMGGSKVAGRAMLIFGGIAATIVAVLWLFAPAA